MPETITNRSGAFNSPQPDRLAVVDLSSTDATFTEARTLYIGVAGDVKVDGAKLGTGIVFKARANGDFPYQVTKVYKVGTTATNIVSTY